jgi:hypothetical protein
MGESRRRREFDLSTASKSLIFPEDIPLLMRRTAEDLAGAFHDEQLEDARFSTDDPTRHRSQRFRAHWGKDSRRYVRLNWPTFVPMAREILGAMLTRADVGLTMKDAIYEAFIEMAADPNQLDLSEALEAAPAQQGSA